MVNRDVKLEVTLLTDSTPLAGKTIHFYHKIAGAGEWTSDGTNDTDNDGYAYKTLSLTIPQSYDFKAEFEGDDSYDASQDTEMDYRVKGKTTLTLTVTPQ
jgi:hypothetical protein